MEKCREGQKELHCDYMGLEKAFDRVVRQHEVVAEKYVRVVQDM